MYIYIYVCVSISLLSFILEYPTKIWLCLKVWHASSNGSSTPRPAPKLSAASPVFVPGASGAAAGYGQVGTGLRMTKGDLGWRVSSSIRFMYVSIIQWLHAPRLQ